MSHSTVPVHHPTRGRSQHNKKEEIKSIQIEKEENKTISVGRVCLDRKSQEIYF